MLEAEAQRISRLVLQKLAQPVDASSAYHRVDVNRMETMENWSIAAEILAWHAAVNYSWLRS